MPLTAISVSDVHKSFGRLHVLRGIDVAVREGEGVVLLGANGCGKSTLMRCLNGLERHDSGRIAILGTDISAARGGTLRQVRRQLGVVFQKFDLVGNVSVFQNVLYGALGRQRWGMLTTFAPLAPSEERERAMACLERVGLADKAGQSAQQLSGGQQQRVAIARMLMQRPRIVLADEPVASLDPRAGREVMELLWAIVRDEGLTVFCSLHQLALAREYGDRIVGMKAGRIVLDGAARAFSDADLGALYEGAVRVDADEVEPTPMPQAAVA